MSSLQTPRNKGLRDGFLAFKGTVRHRVAPGSVGRTGIGPELRPFVITGSLSTNPVVNPHFLLSGRWQNRHPEDVGPDRPSSRSDVSDPSAPLLVVYLPPTRACGGLRADERQRFIREAQNHRCRFPESEVELLGLAPSTNVYIGVAVPEFVSQARGLKWMQQLSTGTEWLRNHKEAAAAPFILTNISDNHHRALAEHVMAWILSFARQLPRAYRFQAHAAWDDAIECNPALFELRQKTLLVLGFGSIGSDIAKLAAVFDMEILAMRKRASDAVPPVKQFFDRTNWHRALSCADLIVNALPLTKDTERLIDATAFSRMKRGAYFFNIGRGATVDEEALLEALSTGHLAGAGLDVFQKEPLPRESPFWDMPNVIITSHGAGASPTNQSRRLEVAWDNLRRYINKHPLRNVVDKTAGY